MLEVGQSVLGLVVLVLIAWGLSEARHKVRLSWIIIGVGLQLILALVLLKIPGMFDLLSLLNRMALAIDEATAAGTSMVFGYLGGGPLPFEQQPGQSTFIFAFRGLPIIIVMSALSALLFHWRVLPVLVQGLGRLLQRSMGVSGALGLGGAANIFMGMLEAPLVIRPYLARMNRSELFALMVCGMTTVAGTVMVLYATFLQDRIPNALSHILIASLISAPAAITVARIMVPATEQETEPSVIMDSSSLYRSSIEAITEGVRSGLKLFLNIVAMLIVFVALVHLLNMMLSVLPLIDAAPITLERVLGWLFAPVVWLLGVPWSEAVVAGSLMGIKTALNELLAYLHLAQLGPDQLSERSALIMTYALCGFANPGSLGVMLGGMGVLLPERHHEVMALGFKSVVAGTIGSCMTGAVVAIVMG
ncbi:NupC/NupG family nucleoside CNT transporter [Magnetococcus sp. PR-3]|uniref:NupC/NupG family nucleoside CNT transporter n=1 Tax=Magnetococcus sp. PR-3 TaxID=3120355 RepID=UPI002FCE0B93